MSGESSRNPPIETPVLRETPDCRHAAVVTRLTYLRGTASQHFPKLVVELAGHEASRESASGCESDLRLHKACQYIDLAFAQRFDVELFPQRAGRCRSVRVREERRDQAAATWLRRERVLEPRVEQGRGDIQI